MRVLHVIESACQGGAQRGMELMLRGLTSRGFDVAAALPFDGPLVDRLRCVDVPCYDLPIERRLDTRAGSLVADLVRRENFQLVHVHTPKAGMLVRRPAHNAGAIVVMSVHGLGNRALRDILPAGSWEWLKKSVLVFLEAQADRFTDHFIFVCQSDMDRGFYPREYSSLIYNGIDPDEYPFSEMAADPVILFPARLSVQKDPVTLLEAVSLLKQQAKNVSVLMAGSGERRAEIESVADRLGISSQIGFLDGTLEGPALFAPAMLTVLTTHWEGQPYVLLESMASGRPVIATNVGGVAETLGPDGIAVPVRDARAVADAIARLLDNPELRRHMAAAARKRLEELFTVDRQIDSLIALYHKLAVNNR